MAHTEVLLLQTKDPDWSSSQRIERTEPVFLTSSFCDDTPMWRLSGEVKVVPEPVESVRLASLGTAKAVYVPVALEFVILSDKWLK